MKNVTRRKLARAEKILAQFAEVGITDEEAVARVLRTRERERREQDKHETRKE
jgi:hypothetical protein